MDGLTLARSVAEIQCLAGGKVEKIQQPEKDELLFVVHSCGKNERLHSFLSALRNYGQALKHHTC